MVARYGPRAFCHIKDKFAELSKIVGRVMIFLTEPEEGDIVDQQVVSWCCQNGTMKFDGAMFQMARAAGDVINSIFTTDMAGSFNAAFKPGGKVGTIHEVITEMVFSKASGNAFRLSGDNGAELRERIWGKNLWVCQHLHCIASHLVSECVMLC